MRNLADLLWAVNASTFLGYAPGMLMVVKHTPGGGFYGAAQELHLSIKQGNETETFQQADFPPPSRDVMYSIGGPMQ
jgi:hypothetical protein